MAIYYCPECDELKDDDYDPGETHPTMEYSLICPDCLIELFEDDE